MAFSGVQHTLGLIRLTAADPEHMMDFTEVDADEQHMGLALELARRASHRGEVPVGAVVVRGGTVVASGSNDKESRSIPTAHAEMVAIEAACHALGRWRLNDCTLYTTLEPCVMCAGACLHARFERVVFGASDPKFGGVQSLYEILSDHRLNHRCAVRGGVLASESAGLLRAFFQARRLATSVTES